MVDVHGCVITSRRYTLLYIRYADGVIYISAWASALLVQLTMGNARASECGTGNCKTPTLFHIYNYLNFFNILGELNA